MNEVTITINSCIECRHCTNYRSVMDEDVNICYHLDSKKGGRYPLVPNSAIPDWCPLLKGGKY